MTKTLVLNRSLGRKSNSLLVLKLLRNGDGSKGSSNSRRFNRATLVNQLGRFGDFEISDNFVVECKYV